MAHIDLPLPKSPWPIWLLTAFVIVGLPATSWVYFPALLNSGSLPPESDSIAIPMYGSVLLAALLTPIALSLTFLCARRYVAGGTVFVWRRDRPILSLGLSVIFGIPAVFLLVGLAQSLAAGPLVIEGLWAPYVVVCVTWFAILRAAALSKGTLAA